MDKKSGYRSRDSYNQMKPNKRIGSIKGIGKYENKFYRKITNQQMSDIQDNKECLN